MDCTHLRYPTVVTVATYRVIFRATTLCRLSSIFAIPHNSYFRAEKKELRKRKKKDRNMKVPLSSSWLDDRGKI